MSMHGEHMWGLPTCLFTTVCLHVDLETRWMRGSLTDGRTLPVVTQVAQRTLLFPLELVMPTRVTRSVSKSHNAPAISLKR